MVDKNEIEARKVAARRKRIVAAERRASAIDFRRLGMSYEAIGKQLQISAQAAHQAVLRAMRAVQVQQDKDAEIVKVMEFEKLDRLELAMWPGAIKGNTQCVDRVLKIMERRAKMMGTDAPEKHANTDSQGGDLSPQNPYDNMSREEISARIWELDVKMSDKTAEEHIREKVEVMTRGRFTIATLSSK